MSKLRICEEDIDKHGDLDKWNQNDQQETLNYLQEITGTLTVPRIFVNGHLVGGKKEFDDQFLRGGKLTELRGA